MHLGMVEFPLPFSSHCDLALFLEFVSGAYFILFEVGIPNFVCGYIFGWWIVTYHFGVTVTLTSDLVF